MALTLSQLLIQETKAQIYAIGLELAEAVGLDTTTWQVGDPTRSLYSLVSDTLARVEEVVAVAIAGGLLDYAEGAWLTLLAKQVYNVDRVEATYATTDVVLTNVGGGVYDFDAGDITVQNTSTGKTYHSTTGGHLGAGGTLTITVEADEAGSDSSAGAGEIDDLVTTVLGVTVSNATAAIGLDEESATSLRQRCRDKLGALSPSGPRAAYSYVARASDLTGTTGVTRCRVYADSDTGEVLVYVAGPAGAVSSDDRDAVEDAIIEWAVPLCITPTVASASNVTVAVTYTLWVYRSVNKTEAEVKAAVEDALEEMFSAREIGGDILTGDTTGNLYKSLIESTIRSTFDQAFRVSVSSPVGDTALDNDEVPALGTVTGTIVFVDDP